MEVKKVQEELRKISNLSLSFAGCGFLGIYYVGVGMCLKKFASHFLLQNIVGTSAGALVATFLLLDMPLDFITSEFFQIVATARNHSLGPFSPAFDIQKALVSRLHSFLPIDAHLLVNGRLHISLTRINDGKNIVVSRFNSRKDLIDALSCSFFIPGFSGIVPPKFHGVRYMDGVFSDNLVTLNDNTVTVSPFCGESDICPKDGADFNFFVNLSNTSMEVSAENAARLLQALIPPSPKELSDFCHKGYNDALDFLLHNKFISCYECTTIQKNFILSKEPPKQYDPECNKCVKSRDESINASMPEQVLDILTTQIEGPNSAMIKFLNTLAIPVLIPFSIANFCLQKISAASTSIYEFRRSLTENLHQVFIDALRELHSVDILPEEDDGGSFSSSDDGFSEDNDRKYMRRGRNFK